MKFYLLVSALFFALLATGRAAAGTVLKSDTMRTVRRGELRNGTVPVPRGWMELNLAPGPGMPSMVMGLGTTGSYNDISIYASGMQTGSGPNVGSGVWRATGEPGESFSRLSSSKGLPFMEMDLALGSGGADPSRPHGVVCGMGFPIIESPLAYFVNSTFIDRSTIHGGALMGVVQGCSTNKDGKIALGADQMGGKDNSGSALISRDGGKTFQDMPLNMPVEEPGCTFPRYGAVGDPNTFYITMGDWPSKNTGVSAHELNVRNMNKFRKSVESDLAAGRTPQAPADFEYEVTNTRKIVIDPVTKKPKQVFNYNKSFLEIIAANKAHAAAASGSGSGPTCTYSAEIVRTTDGGKNWQKVFGSEEKFYFNEITCWTANHCVAVGEGFAQDGSGAPGGRAYTTFDGVNWNRTLFVPSSESAAFSFFSVATSDEDGEAWIGATKQSHNGGTGIFYHTKDGGKTWKEYKHNMPLLMEITDIAFPNSPFGDVGFATAMTAMHTSSILRYDRRAICEPNGSCPPQQKFIEQKNCVSDKCVLCEAIEFPEYQCLRATSGSAIIKGCGDGELTQEAFETSDCTGKSQISKVPVNKCLKSNQGNFFEFECNDKSPRAPRVNSEALLQRL